MTTLLDLAARAMVGATDWALMSELERSEAVMRVAPAVAVVLKHLDAGKPARAPGFYWVRHRRADGRPGGWEVARWHDGAWKTHGVERERSDADMAEINEAGLGLEP